MDVFEAVKTMLAVRDYEEREIPEELVERIVQAARLTGSSRNTQQWDFVVIRDKETLRRLGELARTGSYIAQAPLAIAVIVPEKPVGYIDGTRATQDMMLVAWSEGVGSNWVGNVNTDEVKELLAVPRELMVLNVTPFGYPVAEIGDGIKDRKPLSEVAHAEKYGRAYSA